MSRGKKVKILLVVVIAMIYLAISANCVFATSITNTTPNNITQITGNTSNTTSTNTTGATNTVSTNTSTNTNTNSTSTNTTNTSTVGNTSNTKTNSSSYNTTTTTTQKSDLPEAGSNPTIIFILLALIAVAVIAFKKVKDLDIE